MKTLSLFILITSLLSCAPKSNETLILGEWKVSKWVDSRNNVDLLKTQGAPRLVVNFKKDSAYVSVTEKGATDNMTFKWILRNDSLELTGFATYKIKSLDDRKCILEVHSRDLFTNKKEMHLETITLIKK